MTLPGRHWTALLALGVIGALLGAGCGGSADEREADTDGDGGVPGFSIVEVPSEHLPDGAGTIAVRLPDGETQGMAVLMHGRGQSVESAARLLADVLEQAPEAAGNLALAVVDGGESSYYHDREGGGWGTWVLAEAIPAARERAGLAPDAPVVLAGISMGGYGAMHLARLQPAGTCAAFAHSPALWLEAGATPEGAFDDAEDFFANDVLAAAETPGTWSGTPIRIDIGRDDTFLAATEELAARLDESGADVELVVREGGHEAAYWQEHAPGYLAAYAEAAARCAGDGS